MINLLTSRMNRVMRTSISISEACNKHASDRATIGVDVRYVSLQGN
jgi:hypothetical protein